MKIAATFALSATQREAIARIGPNTQVVDRECRTAEDIAALLDSNTEVLLTFRIPSDAVVRSPKLKWVQLLSAGADHVLREATPGDRFTITTASGLHSVLIGEYCIGSILAFTHRFHTTLRGQLKHEWLKQRPFMTSVRELRGSIMGILGYGSIGRETARMGQALGMAVLALKRNPDDRVDSGWTPEGVGDAEGKIPARFYGPSQCKELMAQSDFVVVTLPLTPETRGFIGVAELAAAKPEAYIVNIGRGGVIDEPALIAALKEGRIAGAGLDVFEREPLPSDSPLWDMENVILTPHSAGSKLGYFEHAFQIFIENLRRFAAERPLLNQVDRTKAY
jgi:phosphoglycerate dehydrogenase-like enzyme